jgi:hypothetical protein
LKTVVENVSQFLLQPLVVKRIFSTLEKREQKKAIYSTKAASSANLTAKTTR